MKVPRILLCAGASGSGKTMITCGILQAFKNRGLNLTSFKCGPDYIDPMFHKKVIGTRSGNLDTFFTDEKTVRYLMAANSKHADLAVIEGVMGYYDGTGGITTHGSAYEVASITETPAILIVNCKGMSLSILPYIKGFLEYKENSRISGVLLNQISPMLYPRIKEAIEQELSIPVVGYLPKVKDCVLESRHLGLMMPDEILDFRSKLNRLAEEMEKSIDLDLILRIAQGAVNLEEETPWKKESDLEFHLSEPVRIGLAEDEAFCFIYQENISLLKKMGAQIVRFSPIHDKHLPEALDGILLYGGYPELWGRNLEENISMRQEIREAFSSGMPMIAECGGFMYLHQWMEDMEGQPHRGAGVIPGHAFKTEKLGRFGYITLTNRKKKAFDTEFGVIPAHEFHYFDSDCCGEDYFAQKPAGKKNWNCIHGSEHLMAGFPHLYYYGNPSVPKAFLETCLKYKYNK